MKNFNLLSSLPTSALTKIETTEKIQSENRSSNDTLPDNGISEIELIATGEHTKQTPFTGPTDIPTEPNKPNSPTGSTNVPTSPGNKLGSVIGGKTAADLLDILFPSLCVWAISAIGYKIGKGKLQMTAKEKEVLAPAMQQYLDSINVDFNNPLYNLLFVVGSIYTSKVIDILPELEKVKKDKKESTKVMRIKEVKTEDEIVKEIYLRRKKTKEDARQYFEQNKDIFLTAPSVDEAIKYIKEQSAK